MSVLIEIATRSNRYQIERLLQRKSVILIEREEEVPIQKKFASDIFYNRKLNLTVHRQRFEILTSYRLLQQNIPDERSILRPIAHSSRAEVLLSKLAQMISLEPTERVPRLADPTHLTTSTRPVWVSKFSPKNSVVKEDYKGVGFSILSQTRSWTIRRGKLVRIVTFKLKDQFQDMFRQKRLRNFDDAVQYIIEQHIPEQDV